MNSSEALNIFRTITGWAAAICILLLFFPLTCLAWLFSRPFQNNARVVHRMINLQSIIIMNILPVASLTVKGKEKAIKGQTYIIIANHQSLLDTLVINCLGWDLIWISKAENLSVPLIGWYLRMAGYITVDRKDEESKAEMLSSSYDQLKKGNSIMIFPEGTRNNRDEPAWFRRGAFQLAIKTNIAILPLAIEGTGKFFPGNGWVIKDRKKLNVSVLDPVSPLTIGTDDVDEMAKFFRKLISVELNKMRDNLSYHNQ